TQPGDDLDRVFNRRFVDVDLLEPAKERPVLFEMVAEFLVGGRPDAADRSGRKLRLQEVRRIHRSARSCTRADHRVDLVDEQDGVGHLLELVDDRLQSLLKVAAVAGAGEQGAHVERVNGRALQYIGNIAFDDLAREPFGDRGLSDAWIADIERVVLRPPAEDLNGPVDLGHAPDQRIDLALACLLVEVDGELLEGGFLLPAFLFALVLGALGGPRLGRRLTLADAVADVGHGIESAHVLLLHETDGIALALGKECDEDVRPGHLVAARRLDVEDRTLDYALEAAGRSWVRRAVGNERPELIVEILLHAGAKLIAVDSAGGHHLGRVLVVDERDQEVLQGRIFVPAAAGLAKRVVEGLFELTSETGHYLLDSAPGR